MQALVTAKTLLESKIEAQKFSFDEATHTYRIGDMIIPGCTKILKGLGIIDTRWAKERDRIRGQAIHLGCQYLAKNCLDMETVDTPLSISQYGEISGYLAAYSLFLKKERFDPKILEKPMCNELYLFGCTPDQIGLFGDKDAIVEIKSGIAPAWVCLQTAAQAYCFAPYSWWKVKRFCLELHEDATYKLIPQMDINDGGSFLAMVSAYTWKLNLGIKDA